MGASRGKFKGVVEQPDGAVRWKLFGTEEAARIWLDTKGRYVPQGSKAYIEKVK